MLTKYIPYPSGFLFLFIDCHKFQISIYLSSPDASGWHGAILCLYQLVKNYEYKKSDDRGPLHEAMNLLLPLLYQLIVRLMPDSSDLAVLLQKEGLKVYFALTQYTLPLDLINKDMFTQWMEICRYYFLNII